MSKQHHSASYIALQKRTCSAVVVYPFTPSIIIYTQAIVLYFACILLIFLGVILPVY